MSIIYAYGKARLQMGRTMELSFIQERDPFNVDSLYTAYRIQVKGFLAQSDIQFPGFGGTTPVTSQTLNALKAELETPRKSMAYTIGTDVIVSIPAGSIDAKIGPEPLPCRITEVNTGTFMVECGCIVRVVDCDKNCPFTPVGSRSGRGLDLIGQGINAPGRSPILSLRWTQTETFDENWYSHLETTGHLIVRSDFLQSADNFRPLATPPLLSDYIRTVSKYTISPDGLMLNFHFEDVERDRLPPFPATKAKGTYTVESNNGVLRYGTVHIRLEGQKGTSRQQLLVRACQMCYSKLNADKFMTPAAPVISGVFVEDQFEPAVEVSMRALMSNINKKGVISTSSDVFSKAANILTNTLPFLGPIGAPFAIPGIIKGIEAFTPTAGFGLGILGGAVAMGFGADPLTAQIMPSVGYDEKSLIPVTGLASGQPGISPPDRKRLAGLLTALFRDPCLCERPAQDVTLKTVPGQPTYLKNNNIVNPVELKTTPSVGGGGSSGGGGAGTSSIIEIGIAAVTAGVVGGAAGLLRDSAVYAQYDIEVQTTMDTGALQMPGTGVGHDGGIAAIVTGHGGMMQVTTSWVASRIGKPPQLPTFQSPDSNVVPLYGSIVAKDAVPNMDGSAITYMIAGYYVHAIKDPAKWEIAPPVAPMLGDEVRVAAAEGASFWTNTALWGVANGVAGGLVLSTNANPFVAGGVETVSQPVNPPGFDPAQVTITQSGGAVASGGANPNGQTPTASYYHSYPNRP